MTTFAERFKRARKQSGISQVDLAMRVGCAQSLITKIENDDAERTKYPVLFARELNVSPEWLVFGGEPTLIEMAIDIAGGKARLCRSIGMKPQFLSQIVNGTRPIPPKYARRIETLTDGEITRYQLRPDVFGRPVEATTQRHCPTCGQKLPCTTIGDRIKQERKKRGLSKSDLARRIGVTRAAIGQIESGTTKSPTAENVSKIADALGVGYKYLIFGDNPS